MYAYLWRLLPGPRPVRALTAVVLALAILALIWFVAFPWVDARYSYSPGTVN